MTVLLLLGGCQPADDQPDLLGILPLNWAPLQLSRMALPFQNNAWLTVNIDGDAANEYLLLYAYGLRDLYAVDAIVRDPESEVVPDLDRPEAAAGAPVGAAIFDAQESSEFVVGSPALPTPLQPSASFVPYRIGPSYWPVPNTTFVGRYSQPGRIVLYQYRTDESGLCLEAGDGFNELAIVDPDYALTIAWWRAPFPGYGAIQIIAPGGFRNAFVLGSDIPNDVPLEPVQAPLWSIDALYPIVQPENPLNDEVEGGYADLQRSRLCRVRRYYREAAPTTEPDDFRDDVRFVDDDLGIEFCQGVTEVDPFFPEAVVLKYLLDDRESRRTLLSPQLDSLTQESLLNKVNFLDQKDELNGDLCGELQTAATAPRYRVHALETRAVVEYQDEYRLTRRPDQIEPSALLSFVCAEFAPVDATVDSVEYWPRLLYFSLEHVPPTSVDINGTAVYFTDRFTILDVEDASPWGYANCRELVAANPTGTRVLELEATP